MEIQYGKQYTITRADPIDLASYPCDVREKERRVFMRRKTLAKNSKEFDRRFDSGEDIHDLIDMSRATLIHHGKKVRITLDIAESLVKDIDEIRKRIGVDRGALIKVWLHEKVKQEKTMAGPKESSR